MQQFIISSTTTLGTSAKRKYSAREIPNSSKSIMIIFFAEINIVSYYVFGEIIKVTYKLMLTIFAEIAFPAVMEME